MYLPVFNWVFIWSKHRALITHNEQGKPEVFDSCDRPCNLKWDPNLFSAPVTLKSDRWPRETIGNLFYDPKSYVCHSIAIHEFNFEVVIWKHWNRNQIIDLSRGLNKSGTDDCKIGVAASRVNTLAREWASYQICQIAGCACAGNAGNVFPNTHGLRSLHASWHVRHTRAVMPAWIVN